MFNIFDLFIALDTNLMNGKLNKVLENLYRQFLPNILKSFCLPHPSQMFIHSVSASEHLSEHLWPGGRTGNYWLSWKNTSPSNFLMYTCCCRLCESCSWICYEDTDPVHSHRAIWSWDSYPHALKVNLCGSTPKAAGSSPGLCLYLPNVSAVASHPSLPASQRSERWYESFS